MKYDIITAGNEVQLVKEVNARIGQEKTVKILDGPFVAEAVWCQAILIGETSNRRNNDEIPQRRSGRQDR